MGFGQSSAFGGPISMPALEQLANGGLRYNEFHTTAICSPTRTALLTGRNHHMNNMGAITEVATGFPGNTGVRPNAIAPLAETLRLNGYGTAAFGKYHETPAWEVSPAGPFDRWPTHSGFDKFYGFMGGETNQWSPLIYDGTTRVRATGRSQLPFHERHVQPGHYVDAVGQGPRAREAVLHVFRPWRRARATSRPQGVDRQISRQVRCRLGQAA